MFRHSNLLTTSHSLALPLTKETAGAGKTSDQQVTKLRFNPLLSTLRVHFSIEVVSHGYPLGLPEIRSDKHRYNRLREAIRIQQKLNRS